MGKLKVVKVYDVFTRKPLSYTLRDGGVEVTHIDRKSSPADTIFAVVYNQSISEVWKD